MRKLPVWLLLVVFLAESAGAEPQGGMDVTKWREDLAILREQMPRNHGNLFHTMTREQFDGEADRGRLLVGWRLADGTAVRGCLAAARYISDGS